MNIKRQILFIFSMLFSFYFACNARAELNIETPAWQKVRELGTKGSYIFLFFGNSDSDEGKTMLAVLTEVKMDLAGEKAEIIEVTPNDPKEQTLVNFFKIKENPTVLIIAPNGAIVGYFPNIVDKNKLVESIASKKEAELIKNIQEGRVVFLCFHKDTEPNISAIRSNLNSVAGNFKGVVDIIYISSDDKAEEKLRKNFQISQDIAAAFIIVPPGRAVAKLEGGDITKTNLMRALYSSCGEGGCGSGCR